MYRGRFILFTVLILLATASVWWYANHWYYRDVKDDTRLRVKTEAQPYQEAFCAAMQERFALLEGLHGFAKTLSEENIDKHFTSFAGELYELKKGIRNMSIAPRGVQEYVYPLENNREVIGHDLLNDPRQEVRKDVHTARKSEGIVISGPYELRQGGQGIVARKAVFRDRHFWGLVAMVLDMPSVYEQSGVEKAGSLLLALEDNRNRKVWGRPEVFKRNPVSIPFEIANEQWRLSAIPRGGWRTAYNDRYKPFLISTLLIAVLVALGLVIFARRFTVLSESAQLHRARYRDLFNSIRDTIVVTDNNRTIIETNQPALRTMFGYEQSDIQGEPTRVLYADHGHYDLTGSEIYETTEGSTGSVKEISFKRKDGIVFPAELTAFKLYNRSGKVIGDIGIIRDISERKRYERTLEENVQRKQWLNEMAALYLTSGNVQEVIKQTVNELAHHFPQLRVAYSTISEDGILTIFYARQPTGMPDITSLEADLRPAGEYLYSLKYNKMTVINDVYTDSRISALKEAMQAGGTRAVLDSAVPVEGEVRGMLCFDSPEPKEWSEHERASLEEHANLLMLILNNEKYQRMLESTNEQLRNSVREKEILLKEIHHRVKNNLNVIVSLLRLQEEEIDTVEEASQAFQKSRRRIYSMAVVHDSLYRSESLSEIQLNDYLQSLVKDLQVTFSENMNVEYEFQLEPVYADVTKAVPCGIIVNELISNAQKHAFPANEGGRITISLHKTEGSRAVLAVEDNGSGLPEGFSRETSAGLGLNLVTILAQQLEGDLEIDSSNGVKCTLSFPL
jgi:PAS domain S-box-containing protein